MRNWINLKLVRIKNSHSVVIDMTSIFCLMEDTTDAQSAEKLIGVFSSLEKASVKLYQIHTSYTKFRIYECELDTDTIKEVEKWEGK